jgi:hypothetical protein
MWKRKYYIDLKIGRTQEKKKKAGNQPEERALRTIFINFRRPFSNLKLGTYLNDFLPPSEGSTHFLVCGEN